MAAGAVAKISSGLWITNCKQVKLAQILDTHCSMSNNWVPTNNYTWTASDYHFRKLPDDKENLGKWSRLCKINLFNEVFLCYIYFKGEILVKTLFPKGWKKSHVLFNFRIENSKLNGKDFYVNPSWFPFRFTWHRIFLKHIQKQVWWVKKKCSKQFLIFTIKIDFIKLRGKQNKWHTKRWGKRGIEMRLVRHNTLKVQKLILRDEQKWTNFGQSIELKFDWTSFNLD